VNLYELVWSVWLSGSAAVCGSAAVSVSAAVCGSVWQYVWQCVWQCAQQCAAVHTVVCAQCMRLCAAVRLVVYASACVAVRQCAAVRDQCVAMRGGGYPSPRAAYRQDTGHDS
jgi:uncharacterized membrane protein